MVLRHSSRRNDPLWPQRDVRAHVKCAEQRIERNGLAEELVEAGIDRAHSIVKAGAAGEGDQSHTEQCRVGPNATCRLEAIHVRHIEVKERGVRFDRFAEFYGLEAIRARINLRSGLPKHRMDSSPEQFVVFGPDKFEFTRREHHKTFAGRS